MTFQLRGRSRGSERPREAARPAATSAVEGMPPAANEDVPASDMQPSKPATPAKKPARRRRKQGPGPADPHSPFAALNSLRRRLRAGR
jgi:hypothetical protein